MREDGKVYATKMRNQRYSGPTSIPAMEAALDCTDEGADDLFFNDKIGGEGNDGNVWKLVQ